MPKPLSPWRIPALALLYTVGCFTIAYFAANNIGIVLLAGNFMAMTVVGYLTWRNQRNIAVILVGMITLQQERAATEAGLTRWRDMLSATTFQEYPESKYPFTVEFCDLDDNGAERPFHALVVAGPGPVTFPHAELTTYGRPFWMRVSYADNTTYDIRDDNQWRK